jgi:hypothetical protein
MNTFYFCYKRRAILELEKPGLLFENIRYTSMYFPEHDGHGMVTGGLSGLAGS